MLETRFKVVFLLVVLLAASMPLVGILQGTISTPFEAQPKHSLDDVGDSSPEPASLEAPLAEELVAIPAGPFVLGTNQGGFDERPERTIYLDEFSSIVMK